MGYIELVARTVVLQWEILLVQHLRNSSNYPIPTAEITPPRSAVSGQSAAANAASICTTATAMNILPGPARCNPSPSLEPPVQQGRHGT